MTFGYQGLTNEEARNILHDMQDVPVCLSSKDLDMYTLIGIANDDISPKKLWSI